MVQRRENQIVNKIIAGPGGTLLGRFIMHLFGSLCEINKQSHITFVISKRRYDALQPMIYKHMAAMASR